MTIEIAVYMLVIAVVSYFIGQRNAPRPRGTFQVRPDGHHHVGGYMGGRVEEYPGHRMDVHSAYPAGMGETKAERDARLQRQSADQKKVRQAMQMQTDFNQMVTAALNIHLARIREAGHSPTVSIEESFQMAHAFSEEAKKYRAKCDEQIKALGTDEDGEPYLSAE